MAAITVFDNYVTNRLNGTETYDWNTDTLKVAIVSSAPLSSNTNWADISATEVSGTGYTTGGATITDLVVSGGDVTSASGVSWSQNGAGFTNGTHAVLYKSGGNSPLVHFSAFAATANLQNGDVSVTFPSGVLSATAS